MLDEKNYNSMTHIGLQIDFKSQGKAAQYARWFMGTERLPRWNFSYWTRQQKFNFRWALIYDPVSFLSGCWISLSAWRRIANFKRESWHGRSFKWRFRSDLVKWIESFLTCVALKVVKAWIWSRTMFHPFSLMNGDSLFSCCWTVKTILKILLMDSKYRPSSTKVYALIGLFNCFQTFSL